MYLIIPAIAVFGFGLVLYINSDRAFGSSLLHVYKLSFGEFDTDSYNNVETAIFVMASIVNPLIMLNLIIAIMGNVYNKLQARYDRTD